MIKSGFKSNFLQDTHDYVMMVRTTIEFTVFIIFFLLSHKIAWLRELPQLGALKIGVSFALISSLIFLFFTISKRVQNKSITNITHLESIVDAVSIIWLIFIFGGMNGPFFFFFFLAIMEAAFTMNFKVILIVIFMGIISIVGDYTFRLSVGTEIPGPLYVFLIFFRIVTVGLIGYYSYSFMQSVQREKTTGQKLRLAYEELKKLDKAKSEFLSIASHQLRTPLSVIKGYISMILENTYGEISEKMGKPLKNIYSSNERLIQLVNTLLNISRIEAGKIEVELKIISLEDIISSVVEELKMEAERKNIYIKWQKPAVPLPQLYLDKEKIRQTILNLLDNAIRYTNQGGVTVKTQDTRYKIQIIVSDTGEGMTQEELDKMFESFSRGVAGTKLFTEGAGLGLYVAKKFVEMHNGKIWAESQGKGKGSTFYVELPKNQ